VVSAGNTGIDAALRSPAGAKRAFTVGAIELNTDKRPDWSNFGSVVNVYAPGTGITSAGIGEDDYTYMDGTSHSAPHVAGQSFIIRQSTSMPLIFYSLYRYFCYRHECGSWRSE